ncbi:flavin-containing monooxygenase [Actinophytocola xanthii]|uniref:4-hydroxyacetophenone monooxygenase n=1 Tax=Actinophytocola xanthii TaxID=1912961 RepID=A0A1Q8CSZ2_9PSEU|nr:NAD(P)/FAD-dependent oxidoreductase [Actinophytocola xanthii]OLF17495.1 4-hydroxyacetophenone monooxygenase [Actinophytocola xanthii]
MPSVLVIGAGFGGIGVAIELRRAGYTDVTVVEKADDLGGVWRENTYPGAGCDIPSPYYSYSYAPNPGWPMRFSLRSDILAYLRRVADRFGIRPRYGVEVTAAEFERGRWRVHTASGEVLTADVLVPAVGQLSRPAMPDIPGASTFTGHSFHSARWDHDYDLTGRRVAVIGTGASAIQFVPCIQPSAARLTVFQRTAPYLVPKPDTRYRPWQRRLLPLERAFFWALCEVGVLGLKGNRVVTAAVERIALRHLRRQVPEPELRAKLIPDYRIGCKRVLFSNDYFPALRQPNVHLETAPITAITPAGVRTADGVEHEVDVIIYGTGFRATDFLAPIEVRGLGGRSLAEEWTDGARAYLGMTVPGFPNMFLVYGPNTNLGSGSIVFMLERQARYIRQAVERIAAEQSCLDVRPEVAERFDSELQGRLGGTTWTMCRSWYRDGTGRVTTNWPGSVSEYHRRTRSLDPMAFERVAR